MAIVGAFARIDPERRHAIRRRLAEVAGIEVFDLDEPGKLGLLVESGDVDAAHDALRDVRERVGGVLGVWPVYVNVEAGSAPAVTSGLATRKECERWNLLDANSSKPRR